MNKLRPLYIGKLFELRQSIAGQLYGLRCGGPLGQRLDPALFASLPDEDRRPFEDQAESIIESVLETSITQTWPK